MKKNLIILAALTMAVGARATLYSYSFSGGNTVIPDANPTGVIFTSGTPGAIPATINGDAATIQNVDVHLHIAGGYNGDLYGYLVMQAAGGGTTTALLLNHPGVGNATFGNSGSDLDVILSTSGMTSIHDASATGNLTGTYAPDAGGLPLTGFNTQLANGTTWTLFLADLSGGDTSHLVSWGLDISVVPEPITYALMIFGAVLVAVAVRRRLAVR